MKTANIVNGIGCASIAQDLYRSAILQVVAELRREGVYVCMSNVIARMPSHNQDMLWNTLWVLAREGALA